MRLANRKLIEAHEAERERVAMDLHDDIGQRLAVMRMELDILDQALPLETSEVRLRIRELSERTLALARDVQALSHRLHPSMLRYLGVVSASAAFCRELAERQHVDVAFSHHGIPDGVQANVASSVFRVTAGSGDERGEACRRQSGDGRAVRQPGCDSARYLRRRRRFRSGHRSEWPWSRTGRHAGALYAPSAANCSSSHARAREHRSARACRLRPWSASRLDG